MLATDREAEVASAGGRLALANAVIATRESMRAPAEQNFYHQRGIASHRETLKR